MSVRSSTYFFNKKYWCLDSLYVSCCDRVVIAPKQKQIVAGQQIHLMSTEALGSAGRLSNGSAPNGTYDGYAQIMATVEQVVHTTSPSQTILYLTDITATQGPDWLHMDYMDLYGDFTRTCSVYNPYGYGAKSSILANAGWILYSGNQIFDFDFIITINGSGYWGNQITVETSHGPGHSNAGSIGWCQDKGNIFHGHVTWHPAMVPYGYSLRDPAPDRCPYLEMTWADPQPDATEAIWEVTNFKLINCRDELFDGPSHQCIRKIGWYVAIL